MKRPWLIMVLFLLPGTADAAWCADHRKGRRYDPQYQHFAHSGCSPRRRGQRPLRRRSRGICFSEEARPAPIFTR